MDEKGEPRLRVTGPARITVLGENQRQIDGSAQDLFGRGLVLTVTEPLPPGVALMVEWDDTEVLGEVCSCKPDGNAFAVRIRLHHALLGTKELARLAERLLGEAEPRREDAVPGRRALH